MKTSENGSEEIVFIDHGYSIPDPLFEENLDGLMETDLHEFNDYIKLRPFNNPIEKELEDRLTNLDIDKLIDTIKADLLWHQKKFPAHADYCRLSEDCYLLLKVNFLVIKKAIALKKSLKDILCFARYVREDKKGSLYFGGEILDCLRQVVVKTNPRTIDEKVLDDYLNKMFNSDRLSLTLPWPDPIDRILGSK